MIVFDNTDISIQLNGVTSKMMGMAQQWFNLVLMIPSFLIIEYGFLILDNAIDNILER